MMSEMVLLAKRTSNSWIVTAQGIDVYGSGETLCAAIKDYSDQLFSYIQDLFDYKFETLGSHLQEQRRLIESIIESKE
jgi:hypothetical protein